jgi:hypothetical protein
MGAAVVDVGYRYKRILDNDPVDRALMLGANAVVVNQARVGIGVRF